MLLHFAITYCVDRYGMIADIAIHAPPVHHGADSRNFYDHFLLTDRPITPTGFTRKKDRRYQENDLVQEFREGWTLTHNHHMRALGLPYRIDHRTLATQREEALHRGDEANASLLARLPQIHLGKAAHGTHPKASIAVTATKTNASSRSTPPLVSAINHKCNNATTKPPMTLSPKMLACMHAHRQVVPLTSYAAFTIGGPNVKP